MDLINTKTGMKLIGIGEAVVLHVRSSADQPAHQVRISHPDLGDTGYIAYIPPAGMYRAPRVGDICYVFCNENFHQYPIAWGHKISPELAKQLVGGRADNITIIYSSGANNKSITHKIELDDGTENGIRITTESGNKVVLNNSSNIQIHHKDGGTINLDSSHISLSLGGSSLTLGEDGIKMKSAGGSELDITTTILGTAGDNLAKIDDVVISTHTHIGNLGRKTSPPV